MVKRMNTTDARETTAFRGYLIRVHPFNGQVWIEKDGFRISYAPSVEDAKTTINALLD